jgi:GTPase KRas
MRKSDGFLFVYDVTKRDSIFELDEFYKEIQRTKDEAPFSVVLCGNKSDIEERGKDAVDKKMAKGLKLFLIPRIHRSLFSFLFIFKKKYNAGFIETSAKNRKNIDESFEMLVRMILKQRKQSTLETNTTNQKKGFFSSISSGEKDDVEDFNDILKNK